MRYRAALRPDKVCVFSNLQQSSPFSLATLKYNTGGLFDASATGTMEGLQRQLRPAIFSEQASISDILPHDHAPMPGLIHDAPLRSARDCGPSRMAHPQAVARIPSRFHPARSASFLTIRATLAPKSQAA